MCRRLSVWRTAVKAAQQVCEHVPYPSTPASTTCSFFSNMFAHGPLPPSCFTYARAEHSKSKRRTPRGVQGPAEGEGAGNLDQKDGSNGLRR